MKKALAKKPDKPNSFAMGKLTLKVKLLVFFLLIIVASVSFFSDRASNILSSALRQNAESSTKTHAHLTISRINEWKIRNEGDLLKITDPFSAVSASLIKFLEEPDEDNKTRVRDELERVIFNSGNFTEVYIMDKDSEVILISTFLSSEGKPEVEEEEDEFIESPSGLRSSHIHFSPQTNTYILDIEQVMRDKEGNVLATLGGHVNIQSLDSILYDHSLMGMTGEAYLVTSTGKLVIGMRRSHDQPVPDSSTPLVDPALFKDALSGQSSVREYVNYKQKTVIGYQEYLPDLGMVLIHEHETSEYLAPLNKFIRDIWIIALLIFGLSVVASLFLIFRFTRPIELLTRTAEKIAGGSYHVRAKITSRDEIGLLGAAFNRMTDSLVKSLDEISYKNALLQSQYDAAQYGILAIGSKGEILSWNRSFAELWEAPSGLLKKNDSGELIRHCAVKTKQPDDFIKKTNEIFGRKEVVQDTIVMANGRSLDRQSAPLLDADGKILGRVFFLRDVTKEVEVNKTKNEFVSIASHQLQTPLTAMNWLLENLLIIEKKDKNKREIIQDAYTSALRMTRLVNDLLNVSRLDAGLIAVHSVKIELVRFLRELVKKAEPVAKTKKIQIRFEAPKKEISIALDNLLIENIILNLLSNAIRFSDPEKIITISVKPMKTKVEITVKDQGIGISFADQRILFNKFFRTDTAARYNTTGSGLGLYIIKKIVELCKGDIRVASQAGRGSVFTVTLPLKGPTSKKEGAKSLIQQDISKY